MLGLMCGVAIWVICKRENERKEKRREELARRGEVDPDMARSYEELCDQHPGFIYPL